MRDLQYPKVSVIIPMFNAQAYIRDAIDSVLLQTHKNIEVIVVDDGSTDESRDIVLSYGDRVRYFYQVNSGAPAAPRNKGIRHSTGEMITFLDQDDIMLPKKIELQIDFLKNNSDVGIVLTDYMNFNESTRDAQSHFKTCPGLLKFFAEVSGKGQVILLPESARLLLSIENFSITSSLLLTRRIFDDIGMFGESLKASDDFDFMYRAACRHKIGVLNTVGFRRRLHGSNLSWDSKRILIDKLKSRKKILLTEDNSDIRKNIKKYIKIIRAYICTLNINYNFYKFQF